MIKTKCLTSSLKEVPREWIFEYYLKLNEKLTGQDVKITSIFNPGEKNPSMSIFYSKQTNNYRFKDFSTNRTGDAIELVRQKFNLQSRGEASMMIIEDYNQWLLYNKEDFSLRTFKIRQKYRVTDYKERDWNVNDKKYWTQYKINSAILEYYNVKALSYYKMTKEEDGEIKELIIKGEYIYGYFRSDGTLYKIYQPMIKDNKFIKVKDYIQGTDQLTYKKDYLIIASSLKDIMAFKKLNIENVELIAPDSENVLLPPAMISVYKLKYKGICCLLDIDNAGIKAMDEYKNLHSIKGVKLELSKDISDSIKDHGIFKVKEEIIPLLKAALYEKELHRN